MKATVARTDLAAALSAVAGVIPSRPPVPVLTGVRLEVASASLMTLTATDNDTTITRKVAVKGGKKGVVVVSGHRLRDLVAKFDSPTVEVEGDESLAVMCGRSSHTIRTFAPNEYPQTPPTPPAVGTITAADLSGAIRSVSHAVKPTPLPGIQGVFVAAADGTLQMAATDRFVLGTASVPWAGDDFEFRFVPDPVIGRNLDGDVTVCLDDHRLGFTTDTASIVTRLLDGEGANWRVFLDVQKTASIVVPSDELAGAVARAELAVDRNGSIVLSATDGTLSLAGDGETGTGSEEVDVEGDDLTPVALFAHQVTSILAVIDEPRVEVSLTTLSGKANPVRFQGLSDDGEPAHAEHVVMPVRRTA